MVSVYSYKGTFEDFKWHGNWLSAGDSILPFFEDPLKQGEYHIYEGNIPIGEISERDIRKIGGTKHIASNFGLTAMEYSGTTHIRSPDKKEGYILLQLSPVIVKITENLDYIIALNPNPLKLYDGGDFYLIDGTFKDILQEIASSEHEIIEKGKGELWGRSACACVIFQ